MAGNTIRNSCDACSKCDWLEWLRQTFEFAGECRSFKPANKFNITTRTRQDHSNFIEFALWNGPFLVRRVSLASQRGPHLKSMNWFLKPFTPKSLLAAYIAFSFCLLWNIFNPRFCVLVISAEISLGLNLSDPGASVFRRVRGINWSSNHHIRSWCNCFYKSEDMN